MLLLQKFAGPLVGPLLMGTPQEDQHVRSNMLNMPKSVSVIMCRSAFCVKK